MIKVWWSHLLLQPQDLQLPTLLASQSVNELAQWHNLQRLLVYT